MRFFGWLLGSDTRRVSILCTGILLTAGFIAYFTLTRMYAMSYRLYAPLEEANTIRAAFFRNDSMTNALSQQKMDFLKMEYHVLEKFKYHHKEVGRVYYSNYYSFTVVLGMSVVLTAVLVFLIASKGWLSSSILLKGAFCTLFCISSFLGFLTVTLQQKENYENNFKQYLYYDKIQNNIITFVKTSDQYDPARAGRVVDSFIIAVNNDLRLNNQFFLTIDANKAAIDDISSKLGKTLNNKP